MNNVFRSVADIQQFMPYSELNYNINISIKNKYIYFEIAKNACTTIKVGLLHHELKNSNEFKFDGTKFVIKNNNIYASSVELNVHHHQVHSPFIKIYQLEEKEMIKIINSNDMFKFAFVRNPYSRILSCYLDKIKNRNTDEYKDVCKLLRKKENSIITFTEFVELICSQDPFDMNPHWRVQTRQLLFPYIKYDFIGKVENFDKDINFVGEKLGFSNLIKPVVPHPTNAQGLLYDYYDEYTKDKIYNKYLSDFLEFGYDRSLPQVNKSIKLYSSDDLPSDFNWHNYLILNPDLVQAGINDESQACLHYIYSGKKESRFYVINLPDNFNPKEYLILNQDLLDAGLTTAEDAIWHYHYYGSKEGRCFCK